MLLELYISELVFREYMHALVAARSFYVIINSDNANRIVHSVKLFFGGRKYWDYSDMCLMKYP